MTRITEPHWGRAVGKVDQTGSVIISTQFADVMRALVKNLAIAQTAAEAAQAATSTSAPDITITGTNELVRVFGDATSGFTVQGNPAAVMARISLGF